MAKVTTMLAEVRALTLKDLDKKIADNRIKLNDLRGQLAVGKLKTYKDINRLRKELARMTTIRHEKFILESVQNGKI